MGPTKERCALRLPRVSASRSSSAVWNGEFKGVCCLTSRSQKRFGDGRCERADGLRSYVWRVTDGTTTGRDQLHSWTKSTQGTHQ
jgi:hypothetical protein